MAAAEQVPLDGKDGEVREIAEGHMKHAIRLGWPPMPADQRKRRVTMMLEPDIIDRLKADGRGWRTGANALPREALEL